MMKSRLATLGRALNACFDSEHEGHASWKGGYARDSVCFLHNAHGSLSGSILNLHP